MIRMRLARTLVACFCMAPGATAVIAAADSSPYHGLAREVLAEMIAVDTSVEGIGTTRAAELIVARLRNAGYPDDDLQIVGPDQARRNLIVRLRGTGRRNPVLLLAHLDVVPAHREDWSVPPFTLTEQEGWFYGRGTRDNKAGVATLVTNLVRWKRTRFTPDRDVIVLLTSFEETGDAGGIRWVLEHHRDLLASEFCLNTDSGDGLLENGKPKAMRLEVTHPGGHSSVPGPDNPIYRLASALTRLSAHRFPPRLTPVTRAFFERTADIEGGAFAADMRAVSRAMPDLAAAERLSANPWYNAMLRTTCVPTQLNAGHAENALPQRVTAIVNCRILPGEAPADVQTTLIRVLADPGVQVSPVRPADISEASPLVPAIVQTIERIAQRRWGIPTVPIMETGGTDGLHLRNRGITTYGVSGIFDPPGENRAHGRDERVHVESFYGAVDFWDEMVRAFAAGTP
jgi:acetylornithine deacetylase/succinyl-diaminopimelate desuccinylase-like protein